jgi:hypothetical protein
MINDATSLSLQNMKDVFKELITVRRLDFGPCPVSFVLDAVDNMWRLEHVSAEFIKSTSADQPAE